MAIAAPRSFSRLNCTLSITAIPPIAAEHITFPTAKFPLSVSVADKRLATLEADQPIWLSAPVLVPPCVAALIATKRSFSAVAILC